MTDAAGALVREDVDKTLYWTLSLYVDAKNLPQDFSKTFAPSRQNALQHEVFESMALRSAIEPMFHDIADRERLGVVEDYLLDVSGDHQGEVVRFTIPDTVEWSTEGKTFSAVLGPQPARALRTRAFWYVHGNGALSYHVSFTYNYTHTAADYYFMSLLQKLAAPKEFTPRRDDTRARTVRDPTTDIFALDEVRVAAGGGAAEPFWTYIAKRFNTDAGELFAKVPLNGARARDNKRLRDFRGAYFENLIGQDPFVETPGLSMPRARAMFMFDDAAFVAALLPKAEDGEPISRTKRVMQSGVGQESGKIRALTKQPANRERVALDAAFLSAVAPEHLNYLFLAGFNQNIIDFLNQEAHEVLDSLDPIYPTNEEQEAESFFVRYANPRCFISYVSRLRSLNLGNDYIGTCPYAFLVHVLSLHNEFLVRNFEEVADDLVRKTRKASKRREFSKAGKRFYKFRKRDLAAYQRFRANNVFRYDTEQDLFRRLEERRGIEKRVEDVKQVVENLQNFTTDMESRRRQEDATLFAWLAGIFTLCEVGFQLIDKSHETALPPLSGDGAAWSDWLTSPNLWNLGMLTFAAIGGIWAIFVFVRWLRRV